MGSHGGGIAEAQQEIIEGYGVTEEYTGVPIKSSMETVQVGATEDGVPVFFDKYAFEADHVAVVGRVKPHTNFVGEIESGLHKMMLIGLGKHKGAALYHQAIVHYSFDRIIRSVGQAVIDQCGVLMGLGLVENQYDQTALIKGVGADEFVEREKELLVLAKEWMPRLPFDEVDLLIVDAIGKNISGAGMDTNVVGRKFHDNHAADKEYPKVTRILVRNLTEETHGNASGIGIAEYAHKRAIEEMDREITYINCMTGNHPSGAHIPLYFDTDRICIEKALETVGLVVPENAKVLRIHNTLELGELLVSEVYRSEVEQREDLEIIAEAEGNALRRQRRLAACILAHGKKIAGRVPYFLGREAASFSDCGLYAPPHCVRLVRWEVLPPRLAVTSAAGVSSLLRAVCRFWGRAHQPITRSCRDL